MRMKKTLVIHLFLLQLLFILVFSCSKKSSPSDTDEHSDEYSYQIPEQTEDGWETVSLSEVGMDEEPIVDLVNAIRNEDYREVHGIVIVKDEKLVFETYFPGHDFGYTGENFHGTYIDFNRNTLHNTHSATKSIISALIGIAIDNGFITNVKEKIFSYFYDYSHYNNDEKDKITIEHLLTMTSGFEWNEWDVSVAESDHDIVQFNISSDPIRYILGKPIVTAPGTRFYYNGGGVDLLGEIITRASETRVDHFADESLFGRLGITRYRFQRLPNGLMCCHGDIYIRPRDLAKFGYLFLNNGVWRGNRIISEEWVTVSTEEYISLHDFHLSWADGYGYLWWLKTYHCQNQAIDSFKAMGWGGQEIIVFPSIRMVIVFTGANYVVDPPCDEMIIRYILPAVSS